MPEQPFNHTFNMRQSADAVPQKLQNCVSNVFPCFCSIAKICLKFQFGGVAYVCVGAEMTEAEDAQRTTMQQLREMGLSRLANDARQLHSFETAKVDVIVRVVRIAMSVLARL